MLQHIKDKEFRLLLSGEELLLHTKRLARQISDDYEGKTPLILPVLNGAFMFAADLIKHITIPCEVSFIKLASYYGMESSGEVEEILGLNKTIQDRHIIVLEDIIDSGLTMASVLQSLKVYNPASVELATMLFKPDAFKGTFDIKYIGTTIPNRFVVGYGLDYEELGRNLPDLYELNHG
jgi:hypoxanthine phosphoribosyltransferase